MIHIAGWPVLVGSRLRQRCAWCGAVLIDVDLAGIAVQVDPEHPDPSYPTWEMGALVMVSGNATYIVPGGIGDELPRESCGKVDDDVTR